MHFCTCISNFCFSFFTFQFDEVSVKVKYKKKFDRILKQQYVYEVKNGEVNI